MHLLPLNLKATLSFLFLSIFHSPQFQEASAKYREIIKLALTQLFYFLFFRPV